MLHVMAKQKPTSPTPTKKPNRADDVSVQFFINAELAAALEEYLAGLAIDERPHKKNLMVAALQNYLAAKGAWPRKEKKPADPK